MHQNGVDTVREYMEGIALSGLRHLLEETSQNRFTADLYEGKYYPGNCTLAELHRQYKKYIHKRPKHLLL